jgi:hypothetical protein
MTRIVSQLTCLERKQVQIVDKAVPVRAAPAADVVLDAFKLPDHFVYVANLVERPLQHTDFSDLLTTLN